MRTMNYRLIAFIMATSLFGYGCTDDDVLQSTTGANAKNSGTVSQKNFSVTASEVSLSVFDSTTGTYTAAETTITATIGDRKNQTLTDAHTILFETEYGLIDPSCITVDGQCSVTWKTSGLINFPANDIGGPFLGSPANTIIAYTGGEEAFNDLNNNGFYDDFDGGFLDRQEPYVDVGNNGVYESAADIIIDTVNGNDTSGKNLAHDIADGFFNGPGCKHSVNCSTVVLSAMVWGGVVIKLDGSTVATFNLGGTVTGLTGSMELLNGTETLPIIIGPFTFANQIADGSTYAVTILTQPLGQTCTVTGGNGTIALADVTNVAVDCVNNYSIGGNIAGLVGSVTLQNNGANNLPINANGAFNFAALPDGSAYNISVLTQPVGQVCTVTGGGSGTLAGANVTNVAVNCVSTPYTIGGTTLGLTSDSLTLQNKGGDNLIVNANGAFAFATSAFTTDTYNVTILTQPVGHLCSINSGAAGTVAASNITNVAITCVTVNYNIGGSISNLSGSITLLNNGGNPLIISTAGSSLFNFTTKLNDGAGYNVTVSAQPAGQTCTVNGGTGTVATADVSNITVSCVNNPFTIGGSISGLTDSVTLQNNGGDDLIHITNAPFAFATPILNGGTYDVTVLSQPVGQTCNVSNGNSIVNGANVTNVSVACVDNLYTVGGNITGTAFLLATSLVIQNNSGGNLTFNNTAAPFTFSPGLANTLPYAVTIFNNTTGLTCTITGGTNNDGTGTINLANVTNIAINCI